MKQQSLTPNQIEIYEYIRRYATENGYPPAVREIGLAVGMRSPASVHANLKALEEHGLITRDGNRTRAIRLASPASASDGGTPASGRTKAHGIPVALRFRDGSPILSPDAVEEYILFDLGRDTEGAFALRADDDSMIDAGILPGDIVVFRPSAEPSHGQIAAVLCGGKPGIRRLYRQRGQMWYTAENPAFAPVKGTDGTIIGIAAALIRSF